MINGIINVYKEKGFTSHDVVAKLRGIVGQKKIGHTGTLDPDAEGVLPVCLGKATKVCDLLTDKDKTYEAVLLLGKSTDTQDITGDVLNELETDHLNEMDVVECIHSFIGEYDQIPPMYSALKVNGKKLYELAREGKTVERKSRKVIIHDIRILEVNLPYVRFEVDCSKGTYIRTLCHDIGERLEVGGCMTQLLRTKVGIFHLSDSVKLGQIQQAKDENQLRNLVMPVDSVFHDLPKLCTMKKWDFFAYNGNPLNKDCVQDSTVQFAEKQKVRFYDSSDRFIGIYRYDDRKQEFRIEKMFFDPDEE